MNAPARGSWLIPVVIALAAGSAWFSAHRRSAVPPAVVDVANGRPKLFDFGMGICEQCKKMKPVMERASRELGAAVEVHVLDIRDAPNDQLAERYKMRVIPLIILADGAGNELWRHEGFVDFPELARDVRERLVRR
jgi:thiol-disulfide isomerase/thioredoxin